MGVHVRLEEGKAAAARALGRVHGRIGMRHQLGGHGAVGVQRDAHRARQVDLAVLQRHRLRQRLDQPLSQLHDGRLGDVRFQQQHELVAAHAGHGVGGPGGGRQAAGHLLQHLVAEAVAEGIVDGLEAVQVDEQHRQPAAVPLAALHRLRHPVVEQQPVGQAGERIAKGQLVQLFIGSLQRLRKLLRPPLQLRIEDGRAQGERQQHCRGHRHHHAQAVAAQAVQAQAHRIRRKRSGGHAGVVHAADGRAHDQRRRQLPGARRHAGEPPQPKEDQQRRGRCHDGHGHRRGHRGQVPLDARRHAQGGHADVVHGRDAQADGQRPAAQRLPAQPGPGGDAQGDGGRQHAGQPGGRGPVQVVAHVDGQLQRLHAHEVHRPDAGAHGQRAAEPPGQGHDPVAAAHAVGQVQGDEGRQRRDQVGQRHDREVVTQGRRSDIHSVVLLTEWKGHPQGVVGPGARVLSGVTFARRRKSPCPGAGAPPAWRGARFPAGPGSHRARIRRPAARLAAARRQSRRA